MGSKSSGSFIRDTWNTLRGKPATFPPAAHSHNGLNALLGTVTVGQTATVSIALGIREVTTALAGAVVGERYQAHCRSYRLNGGAVVAGRPPNYTLLDCACNVAGQITVSINAPLLALGASYAMNCDIVKVGA